MSRSRTRSSKKKTVTIAVLVACLLLAAIGGTIAWLSVQNHLSNQFTVGTFGDPTTNPDEETPGQGDDDKPITDDDKENGSLDGHLYEPSWDADGDHKIVPGGAYAKDPYVGMTTDSEDAYVYVYIKNNAPKNGALYFRLNNNWTAVTNNENIADTYEAKATTVDKTNDPMGETENALTESFYYSGLFKYTDGLTGTRYNTQDVWTKTPVFDNLLVKHDANDTDLISSASLDKNERKNSVEVYAFMYQKNSGDGSVIDEAEALAWVNNQIAKINTQSEP